MSVQLQYYVGLPRLALDHLCQVYTYIMSHGSLFDRARVLSLTVKCHLSTATNDQSVNRTNSKLLSFCGRTLAQNIFFILQLSNTLILQYSDICLLLCKV